MTELCIDTSGATAVTVVDDGKILGSSRNESGRHHAESITPCVLEALEEAGLPTDAAKAGLDAVCVGTGPAPFTGLRAGLVSARVFAKAAGIPVYGVCSLDVIARAALDRLSPEGPDDVRLLGRLEVGYARTLSSALREQEGLLVSDAPIPAHSVDELAGAEMGPVLPLDPSVMVRIVRARLARGGEDRLGTEPLYLRRPDIHGQAPERM